MAQAEHRFQPISTGRSFELVVRELRKAIVRGDLKLGEKLPAEPELAAQFGISRSALREALKSLELSGYVQVRRGYGGGTFVSAPEPEEFTTVRAPALPRLNVSVAQLMEVRLAVEPAAARLATRASIDDLLALHESLRAAELAAGRPARLLHALVDFHVAVARASRNPVFLAVIESLRPVMYQAMNRPAQQAEWVGACRADHEHIVLAIESGHPDRAEREMIRHLTGGSRSA